MKGLELAERYYEECGRPLLAEHFGPYAGRIAVGLVGEGSECYGFDDELARDHDWGPGFCLWLTADDHAAIGAELQGAYESLPRSFAGFERRPEGEHTGKRTGVFEITEFYSRFIRFDRVPASAAEWRLLPETYLATATNGRVFADPLGRFTAFRDGLLAFYPRDVRLKKLAARCAVAGQAGQYNYGRCVERGETVAAVSALATFVEAAISIVYLLNKRYRPFYKWMHRGLRDLPTLGEACHALFGELCSDPQQPGGGHAASPPAGGEAPTPGWRESLIERISALIVAELTFGGYSDSPSDFLTDHAHAIQATIEDETLRNLHVMLE